MSQKQRTPAKLYIRKSLDPPTMILYARDIVTPLTVFRCPTHTNVALAGIVGLMGRDKQGKIVVERML